MEQHIKGNETVLDFGSGSGILAIASYKLGASKIIGIELDTAAIENAHENLKLNNIKRGVKFYESLGAIEDDKFDIVVCNIDFKTIAKFVSELKAKLTADGLMIFSGLESDEKYEFMELLARKRISALNTTESRGWIAIEGKAA